MLERAAPRSAPAQPELPEPAGCWPGPFGRHGHRLPSPYCWWDPGPRRRASARLGRTLEAPNSGRDSLLCVAAAGSSPTENRASPTSARWKGPRRSQQRRRLRHRPAPARQRRRRLQEQHRRRVPAQRHLPEPIPASRLRPSKICSSERLPHGKFTLTKIWQQDVCLSPNKGQSADGTPAIGKLPPGWLSRRKRLNLGDLDRHVRQAFQLAQEHVTLHHRADILRRAGIDDVARLQLEGFRQF